MATRTEEMGKNVTMSILEKKKNLKAVEKLYFVLNEKFFLPNRPTQVGAHVLVLKREGELNFLYSWWDRFNFRITAVSRIAITFFQIMEQTI